MEPRLYSHGYARIIEAGFEIFPNDLQRSHGLSAMDTRRKRKKKDKETGLQWSHGLSAMDTGLPGRRMMAAPHPSMEPWPFSHGYSLKLVPKRVDKHTFNGAMAFQPWIRALANCHVKLPHPSMEPWPFSHGYDTLTHGGKNVRYPFNGAMAFQPWIRHTHPWRQKCTLSLQWSHGLSAMDTLPCALA